MRPTNNSWVARFRNGPCEGHRDRRFAVAPMWPEMVLMPDPRPDFKDYVLVGGNGLEPDPPWPGQIRYRLADVDSEADELVGLYELAA
jgi:hypothetical protein